MDIEKLVEEVARAICVEMGNNPDADAGMVAGEGCAMWECFTHEARAVIALTLAAAAEEVGALTNGDLLLAARLHALSRQAGGKTNG